jgi:DNA-binding response OmpR family regulator
LLTDSAAEIGRIVALDAGVDDCIVKPISLPELVARVGAKLRRAGFQQRSPKWEPEGAGF